MKKRSYKQNCSLALAADVIGERWSLLLTRDLLIGPQRFNELVASLKGMGTNLLAARLKDLEAAGVVQRSAVGANSHAYELTERGRALEPMVLELLRWGLRYGPRNQEGFHHLDRWDLLALKALFQPSRAADLRLTVQFSAPQLSGWMSVREGTASVGQGEVRRPDIVVGATIRELFIDTEAPETLLRNGTESDLHAFISVFALPAA